MACVFVVFAESDRVFVESLLLPVLATLGIERWVAVCGGELPEMGEVPLDASVGVVLVSRGVVATPALTRLITDAHLEERQLVPVRLDLTLASEVPGLGQLATAEPSQASWTAVELATRLGALLPVRSALLDRRIEAGLPLAWNAAIFAHCLKQALDQRDFDGAGRLVVTLTNHLARTEGPYPADAATADLDELRKKRQFLLMHSYCEAVLRRGLTEARPPSCDAALRVRRQLGQALIELGDFPRALEILDSVWKNSARNPAEGKEARGLMGRAFKQQYVDAPKAAGAPQRLEAAIAAYHDVFDQDSTNTWCGINEVSLRLRGCRDGLLGETERGFALKDARRICETLAATSKLQVWDHATWTEALLATGDLVEARVRLEQYLRHPKLDAFEVSSTHRQFEQVLQLEENPELAPFVARLFESVKRYRAGGTIDASEEAGSSARHSDEKGWRGVVIRVSDPHWRPRNVARVVVHSRLGNVLSARCSQEAIEDLLKDPGVVSLEASRSAAPDQLVECATSVPFLRATGTYKDPKGEAYEEHGEGAIVAVIDNGIDPLHEAFLDESGKTRILAIWDQRSPNEKTDKSPAGFAYGTEHTAKDIAEYISAKSVPSSLGRNLHGHGTHVASIAAGRAVGNFAGGVAPGAAILVVIPNSSESIGYSTAHVDALAYIDRKAAELGWPVVVNLSQGMNAGAHDGSSLLEAAFDAFSNGGHTPGRIIVKSAGNERGKNGHARVSIADGMLATFPFVRAAPSLPGEISQEHIEFWWSSANDFQARVQPPEGDYSPFVNEAAPEHVSVLPDGTTIRLQMVKRHPDNGDDLLSIDIVGRTIPTGTWKIQIHSLKTPQDGTVDGWIERTTAQPPSAFRNYIDPNVTLTVPGTARSVITVAAVAAAIPLEIGNFSSFGPTRNGQSKPDIAAPGVAILAADGGSERGVRLEDGTSMAAPHVAGAVALVLSKRARKDSKVIPNANQVAATLRQKVLQGSGTFNTGLGHGVPDVNALLAAFP